MRLSANRRECEKDFILTTESDRKTEGHRGIYDVPMSQQVCVAHQITVPLHMTHSTYTHHHYDRHHRVHISACNQALGMQSKYSQTWTSGHGKDKNTHTKMEMLCGRTSFLLTQTQRTRTLTHTTSIYSKERLLAKGSIANRDIGLKLTSCQPAVST